MILICFDGSSPAIHAIEVARSITGERPALVLHVWDTPANLVGPDPFGATGSFSGSQLVELEAVSLERAKRTTDYGVELARNAGFAAEGRLERSGASVWRAVLDVAEELDAELIVLGSRGHSLVESALLGSVSNALVHHARRPVLVVPPAPAPEAPRVAQESA
jgi:nucleotide-binding universal stress UspA family protein